MPNTAVSTADLQAVSEAVSPVLQEHALVLEAAELPGGQPPVLRLVVDRTEGTEGMDLDLIAELSDTIGTLLDETVLRDSEPYELEVASPGATRPLTQPRHWMRNVGRMVKVSLTEGEPLQGLLLDADQAGIEIEEVLPPPKKGMKAKVRPARRLGHEDIRKGKVDVDATAARVLKMQNDGEEA